MDVNLLFVKISHKIRGNVVYIYILENIISDFETLRQLHGYISSLQVNKVHCVYPKWWIMGRKWEQISCIVGRLRVIFFLFSSDNASSWDQECTLYTRNRILSSLKIFCRSLKQNYVPWWIFRIVFHMMKANTTV